MQVDLSLDIIQNGVPKSAYHCPIALRLKEMFPDAKRITVGRDNVQILYVDNRHDEYNLDETGMWFVNQFDRNLPVYPCTITLRFRRGALGRKL